MKSLSLSQPHMLVMVGAPGSGKTFFAEKFSETFHAPCVSYDRIQTVSDNNDDASTVYLLHILQELFKTNHTIIVDGFSGNRSRRTELKRTAEAAGYKTLFIWVQTDEATAKSRKIKESRKLGAPIDEQEYDQLAASFTPPAANERPVVVISGKHTYATQAKVILKHLAPPRRPVETSAMSERRTSNGNKRNIIIR